MSSSGELEDWESFAESKPLVFPIGGKKYTAPPVGDKLGDELLGLVNGDVVGKTEIQVWRSVLGPVWDEMAADGVPVLAMNRAAYAAYLFFLTDNSHEAAAKAWRGELRPELKAALEAADGTETPAQTPPGEANTNPSPASGTSTSRKRPTKAATRGARSSRTGR